jgi:hypothetical protein
MNNISNIRRVYSTFVGLHHTLHYTPITLAHNIIAAEFSAICVVCRGFLFCLLSFHNQVGQVLVQRLNKLSVSHAVISKQTKRIAPQLRSMFYFVI